MSATCSVDGCDRRKIARGLCPHHYDQARFAGRLGEHATRVAQTRCSVDGCEKASQGRLCNMHVSRLARTGSLDLRPKARPDYAARFWSRVERRGDDECWPFRGTILKTGYGQFYSGESRVLTHRYAYELAVGPIPDGLTIDHVRARGCVRKDCCNPAHLEAVTAGENVLRSTAASAINKAKTCCPKCGGDYRTARDGKRFCPPCKREWERKRKRRAA